MNFPSSPTRLFAGFLALALVLLAGCRTAKPTASIGISSPPPPLIGSAPIAAYDDYARGIAPATSVHIESVAQLGSR
jgi:hypothetical protein